MLPICISFIAGEVERLFMSVGHLCVFLGTVSSKVLNGVVRVSLTKKVTLNENKKVRGEPRRCLGKGIRPRSRSWNT